MIANVSAHRRANAFAQALEDRAAEQPMGPEAPDAESDAAAPVGRAEHGRLLALAASLGELPKPELDPDVKVVQRARLVAAMEEMFAAGGASEGHTVPEQRQSGRGAHRALRKLRPRSRWAKGLAAGGLTVGVAAGAFSGVAAASSDALPGDSLYGLKRGMEDFKLGLADDDSDRGELYLNHASTRLGEARRLMERGRAGDMDHESLNEVRRALNGMRHDASEGHRLLSAAYARDGSIGPIAALDSFSRSHRDTWLGLRERLPAQLTDVGNEVSSVFDAIEQEVEPLESLLPHAPETESSVQSRPGSTQDAPGVGHTSTDGRTSPAAPSSGHAESVDEGGPDPSGSGSGSASPQEEGLLGGNTGGLLPPPNTSTSEGPSESGSESPTPEADVTLPPLLPGILPGLGIEGESEQ
ncbi:DUF5667 domain-containing protein [Streptomyces sp. MUM 178J]|uniref:DUF5667 domain-containing protein n=1 Tax=Streptomyces sp. MUM 178J TaxID=2791991 RepID=UPI001F03A155|nr:DUF5667 domain-containing protein [Streptomyces sp. MUM 178J]WRQ82064.1 DUF5667 domain-containing protein [Streptomyces sp. MUM 178J]